MRSVSVDTTLLLLSVSSQVSRLMRESAKYIKIVEWSDEDECFIGYCLGIIGPCCHGDNEIEFYGHSDVKPNPLGLGYKSAKGLIIENKLDIHL